MVGYFSFSRCARAIPLTVLGPRPCLAVSRPGPFLGFLNAECVDFELSTRPLRVLFGNVGCFCPAIGGVAKCDGSSRPVN